MAGLNQGASRKVALALSVPVVSAAVAAAVVLAMSPDGHQAAPSGEVQLTDPGGRLETVGVPARRGDIRSVLVLEGAVAFDSDGQPDAQGAEDPIADGEDVGDDGEAEGQMLDSRPLFVAPVEPGHLLRLPRNPEAIEVVLAGGGSPRACAFESLGAPGHVDPVAANIELRCRLPEGLDVFNGLPGQAGVTLGSADDVVLVPVTAVAGSSGDSMVVVDEGGDPQEREVRLGLSDGDSIEILSGLEKGEVVLDPVPIDAWWDP